MAVFLERTFPFDLITEFEVVLIKMVVNVRSIYMIQSFTALLNYIERKVFKPGFLIISLQ